MTTSAAPKPRITVAALRSEVLDNQSVISTMRESLATLQLALEDRAWQRIGNQYEANGLDLATVKTISEELRAQIVGGGLMKAIVDMRGETIYGDGVGLKGYSKAAGKFFDSPNNVEKLFSAEALSEVNRAHGTDGVFTVLVHKGTKEIVRVPLDQINPPFVDSTDRERTWYVRRTYQEITPAKPLGETVVRYYVADTCPTTEAGLTEIDEGAGTKITVDPNYTAVQWHVNKQVGWPLGIPDLIASLQWAEKYTEYLKNQTKYAEAIASIAWQARAKNPDQAKKMAATLALQTVAGTSVGTDDVELKPMPGNSGVTFDNGRPLAAQAAVAAGLTVDGILGDAVTGAATTLDPHEKKMAALRRLAATSFLKRVGKLLGAPKLEVIWPDFETESPFREAQMIISAWDTGLFGPEEVRAPLAERIRLSLKEGSTAPEGVKLPNNEKTDEAAADRADASATKAIDAKGKVDGKQGQSTGVGKLSDGDNGARDRGEVNP